MSAIFRGLRYLSSTTSDAVFGPGLDLITIHQIPDQAIFIQPTFDYQLAPDGDFNYSTSEPRNDTVVYGNAHIRLSRPWMRAKLTVTLLCEARLKQKRAYQV
jgi:hypothetical protein